MKVIRILVYEGDSAAIQQTMSRNAVKAFHQTGSITITEKLIGYSYPEVEATDEAAALRRLDE